MNDGFVTCFGVDRPDLKDRREVCRYCYNEFTDRITDYIELEKYREYHSDSPFKAFRCFCCGSEWHFGVNPHEPDRTGD